MHYFSGPDLTCVHIRQQSGTFTTVELEIFAGFYFCYICDICWTANSANSIHREYVQNLCVVCTSMCISDDSANLWCRKSTCFRRIRENLARFQTVGTISVLTLLPKGISLLNASCRESLDYTCLCFNTCVYLSISILLNNVAILNTDARRLLTQKDFYIQGLLHIHLSLCFSLPVFFIY